MPTELIDLDIEEVSAVDAAANRRTFLVIKRAAVDKATWSAALVNTFPDSSFAYVESGDKDADGKTTPRSLRYLPYKSADGTVNAAYVGNALARLPQTDIPDAAKASALRKLQDAANTVGVEVTKQEMMGMPYEDASDSVESPPLTTLQRLEQNQLWERWRPLWWAFQDSVCDIMDGDADDASYAPLLVQSIDEFATAAKMILTDLGLIAKAADLYALQAVLATEVTKLGAAISAARRAQILQVITTLQALVDEAMPQEPTMKGQLFMADQTSAELVSMTKRAEAAEARIVALEADLQKAVQTPEQQMAEYVASLPEAVRKQREADEIEKADLRRQLANERDLREKQDYMQQAASFSYLPINADDDWEVFKALADLPKAAGTIAKAAGQVDAVVAQIITKATTARDRLFQLLKAADAGMRTAQVFGERGTSAVSTGSTAELRAVALAKAKQASDSTMDFARAMNAVWQEQPDLYAEYANEKRQLRVK